VHAHPMSRRRNRHDPLQTVNEPRWLVFRNQLSRCEWYVPLLPKADLRASLEAGRQRLVDEGCVMDELTWLAFVFGSRGKERICLHIEALPPDAPRIGHGTHLCGNVPGKVIRAGS